MQEKTFVLPEGQWKKLFLILSTLIVLIMPFISKDYGQSGDEWLQMEYGRHIWEYFFEGDDRALDYSDMSLQYQNMQYYGGLYDYVMEILHHIFPSFPLLYLRHFFNALTGAWLMIFTGLFAWRASGKNWMIGFLALLMICFSPRIFGESMNNPKDIPFAFGFIMAVYYFLALLTEMPRKKWAYALGIAFGFGIAFGVRPAGGLLLPFYFVLLTALFYFTLPGFKTQLHENGNKKLKGLAVFAIGALILGYIIGLLGWPWGLKEPLTRPLLSLKYMTNVEITLRVFFEGVYRPNNMMPWYYELKWIAISNPLIVIIGTGLCMVLFNEARKTYGIGIMLFILFGAFFTPLYMIYKKSSVHDTWRHLFFIYPFWVTMAAMAFPLLGRFIKNEKLRWIPVGIALAGMIPTIIWTIRTHPNQYVYFNETVGGVKGAFGYYDIDYYQNSSLQCAQWVRAHAKRLPDRKIVIASNMQGFDHYLGKDTSWIRWYYVRYNDRHRKEWDYYIGYSRYVSAEQLQSGHWPQPNAVHVVEVDGVPLTAVLERKSLTGVNAYDALVNNQFVLAVKQYEEYVQADPYDENAWINYAAALASMRDLDQAIVACQKAIALDPGRADFYQILANVYAAKGDQMNAQKANNQANSIILRQQELLQ